MQHEYAFEKMVAWQIARRTTKNLYVATKNFPKEELFGVTSQLRRACISISCNLAEGSARLTTKDQNRFYSIAYSSAVEVINLLIVSNDLEYLNDDNYNALRSEFQKITFQINKLVNRSTDDLQEPAWPYSPS